LRLTDYRQLPDDVKRELGFDALKSTHAGVVLARLTQMAPEVWATRVSDQVYREMQPMQQRNMDTAIATIEATRQGCGVRLERIAIELAGDPP
jgi:hypothetical protein